MTRELVMIPPEAIMPGQNVRYGLLPSRLEKLEQEIETDGMVNEPIEVEQLDPPVNGFAYRTTVGNYRHAAVMNLNKNKAAGLMMPAFVVPRVDPKDRLRRQLSENLDRQNLTPMDSAVAIQQMETAGVARLDIRKAFSRPNIKAKLEPASNAWVNMMRDFLEAPKKIQNRLHDGTLGVNQAYRIMKAAKSKSKDEAQAIMTKILEEADKIRQDEFDDEAKMEAKWLEEEQKVRAAEEKQQQIAADLEAAKLEAEAKQKEVEEARKVAIAAYEKAKLAKEAAEKVEAEKALKEAEATAQKAEKEQASAVKTLEKIEGKVKSSAQIAKERAARLKKAREAASKKGDKSPTREQVEQATAKVTQKRTFDPLKSVEIRTVVEQLCDEAATPLVQQIGLALMATFYGVEGATQLMPPGQLLTVLKKITGEYKPRKGEKA